MLRKTTSIKIIYGDLFPSQINLSLIDDILKLSMEERNLGGVRLLFLRDSFFPPAYGEGCRLCSVAREESGYFSNLKFSHQILSCVVRRCVLPSNTNVGIPTRNIRQTSPL
jgi:hypothetical protein